MINKISHFIAPCIILLCISRAGGQAGRQAGRQADRQFTPTGVQVQYEYEHDMNDYVQYFVFS